LASANWGGVGGAALELAVVVLDEVVKPGFRGAVRLWHAGAGLVEWALVFHEAVMVVTARDRFGVALGDGGSGWLDVCERWHSEFGAEFVEVE